MARKNTSGEKPTPEEARKRKWLKRLRSLGVVISGVVVSGAVALLKRRKKRHKD